MKKIIFTGLQPEVTEEAVRDSLEKVGPVRHVSIIRDGDPKAPVVIVEMDISDTQAYQLTTRVTDYWHDGHMINARLMLH
jgi:RNA recognition motif. (a.k.a. RRM, RBD, or RNP domain)